VIIWGAVLAAMVLFAIIWPPRYLRRKYADPRDAIANVYDRMVRAARWLNLDPHGGQTPAEYVSFLASAVEERGQFSGQAAQDIGTIGQAYTLACYSNHPLLASDSDRVQGAWSRLNGKLRRVWFVRPNRSER